jgi:hypothetical protein
MIASLSITVAGYAAEVAGIALPEKMKVEGVELVLNGYAERTATLFRVPIYVASLYVEHPSHNREEIVHSRDTKLLLFRFTHEVSAERAREVWRKGLIANCLAPCRLDPTDTEDFIAQIPDMKDGDTFELRFAHGKAEIFANGHTIGRVDHAPFAEALLLTFLGPQPASPEVQSGLLGNIH